MYNAHLGVPVTRLVPLIVLLAACTPDATQALTRPLVERRTVHVDGLTLRDTLDRAVMLRGVAVGGRSKLPPFFPFDVDEAVPFTDQADAFFGRVSALGAGVVRLALMWEPLEPTRGTYDDTYLDKYLAMMDAADAHGLGVIVEFHQDIFSRRICGDGFPLWAITDEIAAAGPAPCPGFPGWGLAYLDPTSAANRAMQRLWDNDDGLRDDMVAAWRHVATAVKDHPAVVAFEPINEPPSGTGTKEDFEQTVLPGFYDVMGGAIREVVGDEPALLLDGRAGDALGTVNERFAKPHLDGVVYAPHYYNAITVGLNSPSVNADAIRLDVPHALELADTWGTPSMLDEFGVHNTNPSKAEYLGVVYDALDEQLANGSMWDVSQTDGTLWNTEEFSALYGDGSEHDWVSVIDRPVPRAIAGTVRSLVWDPVAESLDLELADMTDGVSEIYLPTRHLGATPAIVVDGATDWTWDAEDQLLLLRAEPGADVTVRATRGT